MSCKEKKTLSEGLKALGINEPIQIELVQMQS